jgi:hypothetical protein
MARERKCRARRDEKTRTKSEKNKLKSYQELVLVILIDTNMLSTSEVAALIQEAVPTERLHRRGQGLEREDARINAAQEV